MASNKNRKYGRNKRSPSCKQQVYRTEANKKRRIAKEAKRQATPKEMKVPRGTMRKYKRNNIERTVDGRTQSTGT